MLLRQVQARPLQGHHLRALRRRGDAPEGAPRAHGPHRPGRARLAHLVLQGRPEPHRLPARHRAARAREGALLRRLDRHGGRQREARSRPRRPRGQGARRVRADLRRPRRARLAALEDRLARRREYFATGKERNFDEDDEFWTRGLNNWAEDQALPTLEETRQLAGGIFPQLAKSITTEDGKKIRELVRQTATRDDRKLAPREIEAVATAAQEIHEALDPLRAELETATGSKKGAITKHIHKLVDSLTSGTELSEDDAELVAGVDAKNLDKAREIGNGLLADVLAQAQGGDSVEEVRELAYDLCLLPGAKKDDLDVVGQWALKVREMVADMDSRRDDAREAAVDGVRRLEETWKLFRELEPKLVVNDEQLFRELKDRFGSPYGFGQYFRGGMGAEAIRDLLRDLDLGRGVARSCAR